MKPMTNEEQELREEYKLDTLVLAAERAIKAIEIDDVDGKKIAIKYLQDGIDSVKGDKPMDVAVNGTSYKNFLDAAILAHESHEQDGVHRVVVQTIKFKREAYIVCIEMSHSIRQGIEVYSTREEGGDYGEASR